MSKLSLNRATRLSAYWERWSTEIPHSPLAAPPVEGRIVADIRGPGPPRTVERVGAWTEEGALAEALSLDAELLDQVFALIRGQAAWTIRLVTGKDGAADAVQRPLIRRSGLRLGRYVQTPGSRGRG